MIQFRNASILFALAAMTACATGGAKFATPQDMVANSRAGANLIMAEKADEWSEAKVYNKGQEGEIEVKTKFVKHFGTTCVWDMEFKNSGAKNFGESVTIARPDQTGQYTHNTVRLNIKPGEVYTVSAMEMRECSLQWGESKDPNACASCGPRLAFMKR